MAEREKAHQEMEALEKEKLQEEKQCHIAEEAERAKEFEQVCMLKKRQHELLEEALAISKKFLRHSASGVGIKIPTFKLELKELSPNSPPIPPNELFFLKTGAQCPSLWLSPE